MKKFATLAITAAIVAAFGSTIPSAFATTSAKTRPTRETRELVVEDAFDNTASPVAEAPASERVFENKIATTPSEPESENVQISHAPIDEPIISHLALDRANRATLRG